MTIKQKWLQPVDPDRLLATLLPAAAEVLAREDAELCGLFQKNAEAYATENHGLAYWLYETTLVYLVFKAWIPYAKVVWDSPSKGRTRIDLRIEEPERLWFEAKWCNGSTSEPLHEDAEKLRREREGESVDGAYLLAFWWNADVKADEIWLKNGLPKENLEPIYWARFPTAIRSGAKTRSDQCDARGRRPREKVAATSDASKRHYFAFAVLRVL